MLKNISVKTKIKYRAAEKNRGRDIMLHDAAERKRRCSISIKPLVRPQPGQDTPKILLTGHSGTENIEVKAYSKIKKANPAPKERRVCLFLYGRLLYLYQRLSIAVSETSR